MKTAKFLRMIVLIISVAMIFAACGASTDTPVVDDEVVTTGDMSGDTDRMGDSMEEATTESDGSYEDGHDEDALLEDFSPIGKWIYEYNPTRSDYEFYDDGTYAKKSDVDYIYGEYTLDGNIIYLYPYELEGELYDYGTFIFSYEYDSFLLQMEKVGGIFYPDYIDFITEDDTSSDEEDVYVEEENNEPDITTFPLANLAANASIEGVWGSDDYGEIHFSKEGNYRIENPYDDIEYGPYGFYICDGTNIYFDDGAVGEYYSEYSSMRMLDTDTMYYYKGAIPENSAHLLLPTNGYIPLIGTWEHPEYDMSIHFYGDNTYRVENGDSYGTGYFFQDIGEIHLGEIGEPEDAIVYGDFVLSYWGGSPDITFPDVDGAFEYVSSQPYIGD